ncbi:hypothetical protein GCM10007183_18520 [Staphylococcus muscae]|uniref:Transposase n=1 Tax=Staphylococcus muscae TaxID=1294 RepID=A0ABQ1HXD5_9STAP|nr:hypothetical protein GCM10007183_18520 [Staphylococcus muscae]
MLYQKINGVPKAVLTKVGNSRRNDSVYDRNATNNEYICDSVEKYHQSSN